MKMGLSLLSVLILSLVHTFLYHGNAEAKLPEASLRADHKFLLAGSSVNLTCFVDESGNWRYYWFAQPTKCSVAPTIKNGTSEQMIITSEGGIYHCKGGRGDPVFFTRGSNTVTVEKAGTLANQATILQQSSWSKIFIGEEITLRCEIQDGGSTQWVYEWKTDNSEQIAKTKELWVVDTSVVNKEDYWCRGKHKIDSCSFTRWSYPIRLSVLDKPKAQLSAEMFLWQSTWTLTCSIKTLSTSWKYYWFKDDKSSEFLPTQGAVGHRNGQISVSQKGSYWCRGGRGDPVYYSDFSQSVNINKSVPNSVTVTLKSDWSMVYPGEKFTLACEIQGGDTEWEYDWRTTSSYKPSNQQKLRVDSASPSHTGKYACRGRNKGEHQNLTKWSETFNITVSENKPEVVLSVSPSWLSPGASVTLSCEVKPPSAGWSFFWYKIIPKPIRNTYNFNLLSDGTNGIVQNTYTVWGQMYTAGYVCRAGRGEPVYYTDYSQPKFVWSADLNSAASLTVSPDRVPHFTSDCVSLSCEGNSTEWAVLSFTGTGHLSYICDWGSMTGSTCDTDDLQEGVGEFWCASGSGHFSNAVNITVQKHWTKNWSTITRLIVVMVCGVLVMAFSVVLCCQKKTKEHEEVIQSRSQVVWSRETDESDEDYCNIPS